MSDDAAMFRSRANAELANARAATLDNVRERATRSAHAWGAMADRAERTSQQRAERAKRPDLTDKDTADAC